MKNLSKLTSQLKAKEEPEELVGAETEKNSHQCDLSHIDVSLVTNFSFLFYNSKLNGDISSWERYSTSGEKDMFLGSKMAEKLGTKNPSFGHVESHFLSLKLGADSKEPIEQSALSGARL